MGGIISTFFIGIGAFLLGNLSNYQAEKLIVISLEGINLLCNTIILASATILGLLLTLLSISFGTNSELKNEYYNQILQLTKLVTVLFIFALILFQLFNIPLTRAENVPPKWYPIIYWTTLLISSLLSGIMVTAILILFSTVSSIIRIVGTSREHPLTIQQKDSNK